MKSMMMVAAARTGSYRFLTHWFLMQEAGGNIVDVSEEQPEGTERHVLVEFDFSAEEPMVMCDRDGGGYPGSAACCDITAVKAKFEDEWVEVPMEFVEEFMEQTLIEKAWEHVPGLTRE